MKTKVFFMCMAVCAMMTGLVSCDPINNDASLLVGQWEIKSEEWNEYEVEFTDNDAIVSIVSYDANTGETSVIDNQYSFTYSIQGNMIKFVALQNMLHQTTSPYKCEYHFSQKNHLIIKGFKKVLYHNRTVIPCVPEDLEEEVVLHRK